MGDLSNFTEKDFEIAFRKAWHKLVTRRYILPASGQPKCYILGGQPGVGKTTLRNQILDENPNFISLDADECKTFHPKFKEINSNYPEEAHEMLKTFSGRLKDALTEKALKEKYNVIIETTFRDPNVPIKILSDFKKYNYQTGVLVQTCNLKISWQSCLNRKKLDRRHTDKEFHDNVVANLAQNVAIVQSSGLADTFKIYERNSKNEIVQRYNSEQSSANFEPSIISKITNPTESQSRLQKYLKTFKKWTPIIATTIPCFMIAENAVENYIDAQAFTRTTQELNIADIQLQELRANDFLNNMDINKRQEITDYYLLSDVVYNGSDKLEKDPRRLEAEKWLETKGWKRVVGGECHTSSSFDAALFTRTKSDGTQETVIAIRGTDPDQGFLGNDIFPTDVEYAVRRIPFEQFKDMVMQVNAWKEAGLLKGKIIVTGHSLGGGEAGLLKLVMSDTIQEAYTVNSADYGNLHKGATRLAFFNTYPLQVQDALINHTLNAKNIDVAKGIYNLHGDINGSFFESVARSIDHSISNPNQKLGHLANIPSSEHGVGQTTQMLLLSNILVAATGKSNAEINAYLKNIIENDLGNDKEYGLFDKMIAKFSSRLNIVEKNQYMKYDQILRLAINGDFKISLQEVDDMILTTPTKPIENPLENNQTLEQMPRVAKKEDEYDINEEYKKTQILQQNEEYSMPDKPFKFGSFNNQNEEINDDNYEIIEEEKTAQYDNNTKEPKPMATNNENDDFMSVRNFNSNDEENNNETESKITQEQVETLDDSAFYDDTTQNPFNKEAFAFNAKRDATQEEIEEFEKTQGETNSSDNPNDDEKSKQERRKRIGELSSKYFLERDEEKLKLVSQGRFPFSANMLNLTACINNQLALANITDGRNGIQYSMNQVEGCFQKDIEASKKAVEKSKESLKQFMSLPASGLFPLALLIHILKSTYEEHKQLKYQLINFVESQELEKLRKMTPDEMEEYFNQKTLINGEADYTTNAQTIEDFKKTFDDEIVENLNSATKFSTNGRYNTADEMLTNNFLDEKLSDDDINNLAKINTSNDFRNSLFDTKQIDTQADKISIEACDNLSKIYKIHEKQINDNIDFLEKECQENLSNLASDDKIFESNKIITEKVMSQIQMDNEEAKEKIADIINTKIDDFHRKFKNTGELDWDRLEKSIDEKAKEINPNTIGLGKFVIQAIDHERLTNTHDTKYFLKDMAGIAKIHDSLSKINFFKNNIKNSINPYKSMFEAIREGKSDHLSLIIDTMPFNKSVYGIFSKLGSVIKTAKTPDYESNKMMITHLLPARLNFLKLYFNNGKENIKNPNFDLMSIKTSDELQENNKISKKSIKDLIKISTNPFKYLLASNIKLTEAKENFTTKDGEILKILTKPFGGVVSQKMDNSLPINDPHRIVGTLLSAGHTPKTLKNLAPVLDKLSFAKKVDLKALTRILPALTELEKHGIKIKNLDISNAVSMAKTLKEIKASLPKATDVLSVLSKKSLLYEIYKEALRSKSFKLWDSSTWSDFKQTGDYAKSLNPTFQEVANIKKLFGAFMVANIINSRVKKADNQFLQDDDRPNISSGPKL